MAYHRQKCSNFTAQLSGPEYEAKMLRLRDNSHSRSSTFVLHIKICGTFSVRTQSNNFCWFLLKIVSMGYFLHRIRIWHPFCNIRPIYGT